MVGLVRPEVATIGNLSIRSNNLLQILPRYDHIINAKSYNSRLAKAQLLDNPVRLQLAGAISGLSMQMEATTTLLDDLGLDRDDEADSSATNAFDIGQRTMTVIAAVNAAEVYKGDARGQQMATALLAKGALHIPASLRKKLEAMSAM